MRPRADLGSLTRRRTRRRIWLVPLIVSVLAGCGSTNEKASADNPANAPHVAVVPVTRRSISSRLEIASEFEPYQEIDVFAKVSGYIKTLDINWGTRVSTGQLLAVLEIPELEQQLELDQAAVRRSEQDAARAQEELARAQSAYTVAHLTYTRLANVQKTRPELVAQEEIDVAQGKDLEASAGVSSARDSLAASQEELAGAKAALDRDKALYAYSRITAPFNGVVTKLYAYTGALLPAGTSSNKGDLALCRLSQNNLLRLVIPVPERAVPDIYVGDTVAVDVSGLHRKFDGKIVRFSGQIDLETRTMHSEVDVPNPNYELVPGMYATVEIPLRTVENALTVPVQAVQTSSEGRGNVLVVGAHSRLERREVMLGIESATDIQILSGLNEGERVVFGEQARFRPGDLVSPTSVTPSEMN